MRPLLIAATIALASCNPVSYIADEAAEAAGEECNAIFDEKLPVIRDQIRGDVWAICTGFYQDIIIPSLENAIDGATQDLIALMEDRFAQKLLEAEHDIMGRFGCVVDVQNPSGWDCNGTFICEQQPITCLPAN